MGCIGRRLRKSVLFAVTPFAQVFRSLGLVVDDEPLFGLEYTDHRGDIGQLKMTKKVLKGEREIENVKDFCVDLLVVFCFLLR